MPLCDTALRLVQRDLYAIRWTKLILDEAERNLAVKYDPVRIKRRFDLIREHFADGEVTNYEDLIRSMRCDEKDRHVLAAAVRGGANQIVTQNLRHFPSACLAPYDIEVVPVDVFLQNSLDMAPAATVEVIREQSEALRKPPLSIAEVLAALSKAGAPDFAQAVENILIVQDH